MSLALQQVACFGASRLFAQVSLAKLRHTMTNYFQRAKPGGSG